MRDRRLFWVASALLAVASAGGALAVVSYIADQAPEPVTGQSNRGWISAPVQELTRYFSPDGSDVLRIEFADSPARFTVSITRLVGDYLTVSAPEPGSCWDLVEEGRSEIAAWVTVNASLDPNCRPTSAKVSIGHAEVQEAPGHRYVRTPALLLSMPVATDFEWAEVRSGVLYAATAFSSQGGASTQEQGGTAWVVEATGGIASSNERNDIYCQADDPAAGLRGSWSCSSAVWLADDEDPAKPGAAMTVLPGAYYNLVDSRWPTVRDSALLVAGALVGLVGAILFRLTEDATVRRRRPASR